MPQRFVASIDKPTDDVKDNDDKVVKEVYASKTREAIDAIIKCIDNQRAKGNEAFTTDNKTQTNPTHPISTTKATARRAPPRDRGG